MPSLCRYGPLFGTSRFCFGDLERWLNLVSAHYIPLIKYEDMVADTDSCLRKVMTFWRVDASAAILRQAVDDHSFTSMERTVSGRGGFVADIVSRGHLRRGRVGSWRDEMPDEIDLLIVGHKRSKKWALRWWRGSVDALLIERVRCSILLAGEPTAR